MNPRDRALAIKLAIAAGTSFATGSPLPLVGASGTAIADRANREERAGEWIARNLRHTTKTTATDDDRNYALQEAQLAIQATGLTWRDLEAVNFSVDEITKTVMKNVDPTTERHNLIREAIRLTYKRLIQDEKKNGTLAEVRLELIRESTNRLESTVSDIHELGFRPYPTELTKATQADRRGEDPTGIPLFAGELPATILELLRWQWPREISRGLHALDAHRRVMTSRERQGLDELKAIPMMDTFPEVWRRLGAASQAMDVLLSSADRSEQDSHLAGQRTFLRWLRKQVTAPEFGLVSAISGSWGSGKSRTLDELVTLCLGGEMTPVYVPPKPSGDCEAQIIKAVANATGENLPAFPFFKRMIERPGFPPLVLILDDWDYAALSNTNHREELQRLVRLWSNLSIRWVLAIDEAIVPTLLADGGDVFWRHYGTRPGPTRPFANQSKRKLTVISGLVEIDRYNEDHALGVSLLKTAYPSARDELEWVVGSVPGTAAAREELAKPLNALLRLQIATQAPVDEVFLIPLMDRYWSLLLASLKAQFDGNPAAIEEACMAVVSSLLTSGDAAQDQLLSHSRRPPAILDSDWPKLLHRAVGYLTKRQLLDVEGERLLPSRRFGLLWGYLLTRNGVGVQPEWDSSLADLKDLALLGVRSGAMALRFLLLDRALADSSLSGETDPAPYFEWHSDPDLANDILWQAAPVMPRNVQYALMKASTHAKPQQEDIFWMFRFVRNLGSLTPREALTTLRYVATTFPSLPKSGLADYCLMALSGPIRSTRWLPRAGLETLRLLGGITEPQLEDPIARLVVAQWRFGTLQERQSSLRLLLRFLAEPGPSRFWLSLCHRFLAVLFDELGPRALEELFEAGWFAKGNETSMTRQRAFEIRREAQVAFGHSYWHRPSEFMPILDRLIEASFAEVAPELQRQAAVFGLRHTRSTRESSSLQIPAQLGPYRDQMLSDELFSSWWDVLDQLQVSSH